MDLNECRKKGHIKLTVPNKSKALSLLEISDIKEDVIHSVKLDEKTVNVYLPLAYDSLREALEALCLLFGYNVLNHVCLGELLKELIQDFDYFSFDRFRYARNSINYYGKKAGLEEGKGIIEKILEMRRKTRQEVIARTQKLQKN